MYSIRLVSINFNIPRRRHGRLLRRGLRVLSSPLRAVLIEAVGTATLLMAIVGSGIAAVRLTDDPGLRLVVNALATVAVLGVLIAVALPISGASFNPAVTLADVVKGVVSLRRGAAYVAAQLVGGVIGTMAAHLMFEDAVVSWSDADRGGWGRFIGELIATAGLVAAIALVDRAVLPIVVPAWILGAYLFTSSTSFANPAVTVGRLLTDSFAGIAGPDVPWFLTAQLLGAMLGLGLARLFQENP
jgi:glycerol uptake facilitator-like aquaporin